MSDMRELYKEVILDHNKRPRNCYVMDCATRSADGHNPLCGDTVKVYLQMMMAYLFSQKSYTKM